MLNPVVVPLMPLVGLLTANLNGLIRGEHSFSLPVGLKTFILASAAFATVWFALLVTAIYSGGETNLAAGVEVLVLFLLGIGLYRFVKVSSIFGEQALLWLFRLSLPLILAACLAVINWG
ncbi:MULTISPECIES: hypothetical protein [Shewanella]|uniref:hypothetical protein n=1 Tax=Shewanella TaxID=22 RepID=UPI001C65EEF3|nr:MULTISPECIES: hypothetical protein [Shewanella]QYJ83947.1 hypothetical protein K0H80_08180 [Shewanella aegiceratis]QYJ88505.1 hypothetical protein K0H81_11820 [Shewanella halotolerans]